MGRASTRDPFAYMALSEPQPCRKTPCMTTKVNIQSRTLTRAGAGGLLQVCLPWSTAVLFSEALISLVLIPATAVLLPSKLLHFDEFLVGHTQQTIAVCLLLLPAWIPVQPKQGLQTLTQTMPTLSPHLESSNSGLPAVTLKFSVGSLLYHCPCSSTSEEESLPEVGVPSSGITAGVHLPGL